MPGYSPIVPPLCFFIPEHCSYTCVPSTGTDAHAQSHRLHICHRQCRVPTMSVRESVQVIASAQRWIFFSPKDQRHVASFCIGCSFHAETNEDECVSRLVRLPAAAVPRFRQHRVAKSYGHGACPICGDGTSQPWKLAASHLDRCFVLEFCLRAHHFDFRELLPHASAVCTSGGLEMRKVSLSGGRAGRVMIFLARSILARGSLGPHETRHCGDHGDRHRSSNHMAAYLNQCIWEVVVGSGGGGGDRLSSEKLAEVGRGDGWGESADAGMGR